MGSPITQYAKDAMVLYLEHGAKGFNASLAAVASAYHIEPFKIDWGPDSIQFFPIFGTPDDLEESDIAKYPMAFLYGVRSRNTHESHGRKFSGPVELTFSIWVTHKASKFSKAARALDAMCSAVEEACNNMFHDGNWPQLYGASRAVCLSPAFTRLQPEPEGEGWRQGVVLNMVFTLDTN